ncbi:hypothetical protein GCM10023170_035070 [Phytohabitans houttuyneae]|uniref:Uncharacterized protein n=1 Tax=Phytohabitans houttuyneae TaxID=1076126 RepID=A0A6V8K593_9ACTN|nr:hypothetical protein Phou_001450 [Phytohabitans houttuyneae]
MNGPTDLDTDGIGVTAAGNRTSLRGRLHPRTDRAHPRISLAKAGTPPLGGASKAGDAWGLVARGWQWRPGVSASAKLAAGRSGARGSERSAAGTDRGKIPAKERGPAPTPRPHPGAGR